MQRARFDGRVFGREGFAANSSWIAFRRLLRLSLARLLDESEFLSIGYDRGDVVHRLEQD